MRRPDSMLARRRFIIRPGIELRTDYDAAQLRALAKANPQCAVKSTLAITPPPLPAKVPELNLVESLWRYMREN